MIKPLETALRTAVLGAMAAAAGIAAFLFFVIAAFLWTQQRYDTIVACGVGAGFFLLLAVVALAMLAISRHRAAKAEEEAANAVPGWLADPAALLMAVQVARSIGFTRLLPLALAAVAAFGVADLMKGRTPRTSKHRTPSESKRAA
jgi:hypothetical protein